MRMSTVASGGFSTKNLSIGYFHSTYIDVVITIFMGIAGANFALALSLSHGAP